MSYLKTITVAAVSGIIFLLSFNAHNAQAQGLYAKLSGGYNVGIGSQNGYKMVYTSTLDPANNVWHNKEEAERVKVNFGKGFTGSIGIGYMFTEQLGAEMEAGYLAGGKNHTSFHRISNPDPDITTLINTEMHAQMVVFKPSIVMVTKLSESLNLHGKFGIVTGKGTLFVNDKMSGRGELVQEAEYYGGWGFGLQGGLGLDYKINTNYEVFSEIKMSNLSYAPTKYRLTKQMHNGVDDLYPAEQEEVSLENAYTNVDSQNQVSLKQPFNFSTASLNVGIKYNF